MKLAILTLALGTILGLTLGVPLGRRVERVAWHADAAITRARITGWLIRDLAGYATATAGTVAIAAFVVWALITDRR